jgi:two-component system response regulator AtoC
MSSTVTNSVSSLVQAIGEIPPEAVVFGSSELMNSLRDRLGKVASANVPVLIHGESGTGKDIIARMVHCLSPWKSGPFVKVNCPASLVVAGSELSVTSAVHSRALTAKADGWKSHRGNFSRRDCFELDMSLQSNRFSCRMASSAIGAQATRRWKSASCGTQSWGKIENGTFRQDLFYRINVVNLFMPPLRERRSDIENLANYFLDYYNRKYNCRAKAISPELMEVLQKYHWPGNVRELENLVKRYVILGSEDVITSDLQPRDPDLLTTDINFDGPISLKKLTRQATRALERKIILKVLHNHHWNRKQAARTLNISCATPLIYKIHVTRPAYWVAVSQPQHSGRGGLGCWDETAQVKDCY